jgi:hypothetical protein
MNEALTFHRPFPPMRYTPWRALEPPYLCNVIKNAAGGYSDLRLPYGVPLPHFRGPENLTPCYPKRTWLAVVDDVFIATHKFLVAAVPQIVEHFLIPYHFTYDATYLLLGDRPFLRSLLNNTIWTSLIAKFILPRAKHLVEYYWSRLLEVTSTKYDVDTYRNTFMQLKLDDPRLVDGHSHPKSAADRSRSVEHMQRISNLVGLPTYYVQRSRSDERATRDGSRSFFWVKDLNASATHYQLPEKNFLKCIVDTDFYLDMPHILATEPVPTILYTTQLHGVSLLTDEVTIRVDNESEIFVNISGSGEYHHKLWNYQQDHLLAFQYVFGIIPIACTAYLIDRKTTQPFREIVLLTPMRSWGWLAAIPMYFLSGKSLQRYNIYQWWSGHNIIEVRTKEQHNISLGLPNQTLSATLPINIFETINTQFAIERKTAIPVATVESFYGKRPDDLEEAVHIKSWALVLHNYFTFTSTIRTPLATIIRLCRHGKLVSFPRDVSYPVEPTMRTYQYGTYVHDAPVPMEPFMSPFMNEGFVPAKTIGNEARAVDARINKVKSDIEADAFCRQTFAEFVQCAFPNSGILRPDDVDEVYLHMITPSQRKILETADLAADQKDIIKSFLKSEAYSAPKDPRIISTFNGKFKTEYSQYTYSVSAWLKTTPFYAFGKSPKEISIAVADKLSRARTATQTDFSRFDGTISPAIREFELLFLLRAFPECEHPNIIRLHGKGYNLKSICTLGTTFQMGTARGSGSPETAILNSLVNALVTFVTFRRMRNTSGGFYSPSEAWEKTCGCIFGGDDGITVDVDTEPYYKSCEALGLKVKAEVLNFGSPGVKFLARVYGPDVWFNDPNNCCDISRALGKLHLSGVRPSNVPKTTILVEKMIGFSMSDAHTPIIGQFAQKVMRFAPNNDLPSPVNYNALHYDADSQYINTPADWMLHYVQTELDTFDSNRFDYWLDNVTCLEDCLSPPLCAEELPPTPQSEFVTVDGETIPPIDLPNTVVPPALPPNKPKPSSVVNNNPKQKKIQQQSTPIATIKLVPKPGAVIIIPNEDAVAITPSQPLPELKVCKPHDQEIEQRLKTSKRQEKNIDKQQNSNGRIPKVKIDVIPKSPSVPQPMVCNPQKNSINDSGRNKTSRTPRRYLDNTTKPFPTWREFNESPKTRVLTPPPTVKLTPKTTAPKPATTKSNHATIRTLNFKAKTFKDALIGKQ